MFWQIIFWALLVPVLIVLGIIYGTSKRLYKLFYILATFTYVITIAYVIDVYDLDRNWILSLLTFSAILMILLGYRLTRKEDGPKRRLKPTNRNLVILIAILVLMLLLIIVSALNPGARRDVVVVPGISREALLVSDAGYPPPFPSVANITYQNMFLFPYVIPDQYFVACWYNTAQQLYSTNDQLQVQVNGQFNYGPSSGVQFDEVARGQTVQRTLSLGQQLPLPVDVKGYVNESARQEAFSRFKEYDAVILAASSDPFNGCTNVEQQRSKGRLSLYEQIPLTD